MYTYHDVLTEYHGRVIPYEIYLNTKEWLDKRAYIIRRDGGKCIKCNSSPTSNDFEFTAYSGGKKINLMLKKIEGKTPVNKFDLSHYEFVECPKAIHLHVHHKFYIDGKLPWEYEDDALVSLCNWCHWDIHQREIVPVYSINNEGKLVPLKLTPCSRCNGAGWFPEYTHVNSGICFRCNGARYEERII